MTSLSTQQIQMINQIRAKYPEYRMYNDTAILSIITSNPSLVKNNDTSVWNKYEKTSAEPTSMGLGVEKTRNESSVSDWSMLQPVAENEKIAFIDKINGKDSSFWEIDDLKNIATYEDLNNFTELLNLKNKEGKRLIDDWVLYRLVGDKSLDLSNAVNITKKMQEFNPQLLQKANNNSQFLMYFVANAKTKDDVKFIKEFDLSAFDFGTAIIEWNNKLSIPKLSKILQADKDSQHKLFKNSDDTHGLSGLDEYSNADFNKFLLKINGGKSLREAKKDVDFSKMRNDNLQVIATVKDEKFKMALVDLQKKNELSKYDFKSIKSIAINCTEAIDDEVVKQEIYDKLSKAKTSDKTWEELDEINLILQATNYDAYVKHGEKVFRNEELSSAYKSMEKHYSYKDVYKSMEQKVDNSFIAKASRALGLEGEITKPDNEFTHEVQISKLYQYVNEYSKKNPKMATYLYEKFYLPTLPQETQDACTKVNDDFGTKIFMGESDEVEFVEEIHKELSEWKKASDSKATYPPSVNLSEIYSDFLSTNVVGTAYAGSTGQIRIKRSDYLDFAFRHELMHINDKQIYSSSASFQLNGKSNTIGKDEGIGVDKTMFREEFRNAGITEDHIDYAYTNKREFVAVAAEGDMNKYSYEFKAVLKQLGMPEWVFKLPPKAKDE